ncbi:MAG TPA: hypothetical protein VLJ13_10280, partial [Brevundimonas sp.]|nr:hypothetical protein [Brevundimonas sp.]
MSTYLDTIRGFNDLRDRENQNALAKRAGGMLATGDATGARNALFQGGDLEAGGRVDAQIGNDRAAKAKAMERFTQGVSRMLDDPSYANDPNGADRAWNDAARFAPQLGINPETLNQDRDSFLKNPKGWASFWNEKAKEEQYTLSPGSQRRDASGRIIAEAPFAPKAPDWRERTKADGSTEYFDINAEAGIPSGSPAPRGAPGFNPGAPDPRQPAANADQVVASLTANGARVTSGVRTPERNAAVGG